MHVNMEGRAAYQNDVLNGNLGNIFAAVLNTPVSCHSGCRIH